MSLKELEPTLRINDVVQPNHEMHEDAESTRTDLAIKRLWTLDAGLSQTTRTDHNIIRSQQRLNFIELFNRRFVVCVGKPHNLPAGQRYRLPNPIAFATTFNTANHLQRRIGLRHLRDDLTCPIV